MGNGRERIQGKLYLSPIKDLFNDEIIAYDVTRTLNFEQITRMMNQAVARLNREKPILHSDQGWQYQLADFRKICQRNGIRLKYVEKRKLLG